jgi:hypothetical protein
MHNKNPARQIARIDRVFARVKYIMRSCAYGFDL